MISKRVMIQSSGVTLLTLAFVLFRVFFAYQDLNLQAINILKRWLSAEYTSYQLNREDISLEQKAVLLQNAQAIEFSSIAARGTPERLIVRVEIAPNPAEPPNRSRERYFKMQHSLILGWSQVPAVSSEFSYFLASFGL